MRSFNIPKWDDSTGLDHIGTDWQLSTTLDFKDEDIVESVDNSSTYLNVWLVNAEVPVGTVWYVRARRNLKNPDTGEVVKGDWIGPERVISEDYGTGILIPKLFISKPSIKDITMDDQNLTIETYSPISNVPVTSLLVEITDHNDNILTSLFHDPSKTTITIDAVETGLLNLPYFKIKLIYQGKNGVCSSINSYTHSYLDDICYIEGNVNNIALNGSTRLLLKPKTSDIQIKGITANVSTLNGITVHSIDVNNNTIIIDGTKLEPKTTYYLVVIGNYKDENNNDHGFAKPFVISTRNPFYKPVFDPDNKYTYSIFETTEVDTTITTNVKSVNEDIFGNIILDDGNNYQLTKTSTYEFVKSLATTFNSKVLVRFVATDCLIIAEEKDTNGKVTLHSYTIDPVNKTISESKSVDMTFNYNPVSNGGLVFDGKNLIMLDALSDGIKIIKINPYTLDNDAITINKFSFNDIYFSLIPNNALIVLEKSNDADYTYYVDIDNLNIIQYLGTPTEIRGKDLLFTTLSNGTTVAIVNDDNKIGVGILDNINKKFSYKNTGVSINNNLNTLVTKRNGEVHILDIGSDKFYVHKLG